MTGDRTGARGGGPVVAILAGRSPDDRYSLHRGYVEAVWAVGGRAVIVPAGPGADTDQVLDVVASSDALVVSGGGDVDPATYASADEYDATTLQECDPERDALELTAVRQATASGGRVLGICRGAQLLAVASGGTLVMDLPGAGFAGHWEYERQHEAVHGVQADPRTGASAALAGASRVNSIHHQAVATAGTALRATAWSDDGVVEAIEGEGQLGVQWHPERMAMHEPRHLAPFSWVVA
jgi:putative glutamine amidotransferase